MSKADAWVGLLDKDEQIIWQGRPDGGITMTPGKIFETIFGLFFAGFALFWMVMASQAGGAFWMFGLLHFSVGLGILFHGIFWSAYLRRNSWYTLTDRRAFIASQIPIQGKRLKSYPITANTPLDFHDDVLANIYFAERTKRGKNGTYTVPVGFERISNGRDVYQLLRDIQLGHREETEQP